MDFYNPKKVKVTDFKKRFKIEETEYDDDKKSDKDMIEDEDDSDSETDMVDIPR